MCVRVFCGGVHVDSKRKVLRFVGGFTCLFSGKAKICSMPFCSDTNAMAAQNAQYKIKVIIF